MAKISKAFEGKKANIGYIVAGYPSIEHTKEFLLNLDESALDLVELGVPYSDPLADGKLIAEASFDAVTKGINTDTVFNLLEECKGRINKPLVFLVYYNLVFSYGVEKFIARSSEVGISGFIIPDLPYEECEEVSALCDKFGLDLVPLISVTSAHRTDKILNIGRGFIYALGAIGVSGSERASIDRLKNLVSNLKQKSDLPVAVGFGVKNSSDVSEVKSFADGAIIGTEIVKLTAKFSGKKLIEEINKLF
ncbi:tryptophan synthase subunit alpha [Campylobacter sp. RM16187]|uniref:tryptophan synthase subunit alpha n=1 Tax=Campylobacter sp. RM16187 TaxID=1660063 RepID=UPI0021B61C2C|nr:tryptophan synthase subunit alpha [Campylobacter sp. RM16187]QKG28602.1 tryptophan synthase, alpha subunit [Campylobacter sp. RM16187]